MDTPRGSSSAPSGEKIWGPPLKGGPLISPRLAALEVGLGTH